MLEIIYLVVKFLAVIVIIVSAWGFIPLDNWWVRVVDFPRIQILSVGTISLIGLMLFVSKWELIDTILFTALLISNSYQMYMVMPYTTLWRKEVRDATPQDNPVLLTIMVSNVLTPNNNTQALIDLVLNKQPDILLTLESDKKWENALNAIETDFPYSIKVPLDNLYGMHLYSKLPLINPQVKYLMVDDIPSIHTQIKLSNNKVIWLYCLHPMPPSPTEADKSTTRDAELLVVGRHIKENNQIAVLAGDLNDVAWSKTTRMFQRVSELLDPRVGRFFVNTFHVKYPFLRWALDHLFHSACFTLVKIERLPSIGSDHFPVLTTLQYEPESMKEQQQNAPEASNKDKKETKIKIEEGEREGREESKKRLVNTKKADIKNEDDLASI